MGPQAYPGLELGLARLQFQSIPTYLGVKLGTMLTFKQHLESVKAKITSCVALTRRLAGTTWGTAAMTLYLYQGLGVLSCGVLRPSLESKSPHQRTGYHP